MKDNVNTTTKPNLEGEQRSPPPTKSNNNSVKDDVSTVTKQHTENKHGISAPTKPNNDSVKDDVNTVTELNNENEQHHDTDSPKYKLDEQLD